MFFNSCITNKNFPVAVDFSIHYLNAKIVVDNVRKAGEILFIYFTRLIIDLNIYFCSCKIIIKKEMIKLNKNQEFYKINRIYINKHKVKERILLHKKQCIFILFFCMVIFLFSACIIKANLETRNSTNIN